MASLRIVVRAGLHDRRFCPLCVTLPPEAPTKVALIDETLKRRIPCQVETVGDRVQLHWVLQKLRAGGTTVFRVEASDKRANRARILLERKPDQQIHVRVGRHHLTTFHYGPEWARPCWHPFRGPFGVSVLLGPETAEENTDTSHQHGIFVGHGDVNGTDNWGAQLSHGWTRVRKLHQVSSGATFGRLVTRSDWLTHDEQTKLLEERVEWTFYDTPKSCRLFDATITLTATDRDVLLGNTDQVGLLTVVVPPSMAVVNGGAIINSFGGANEAGACGRRAHWCSYSGQVNGRVVGITVMDYHDRSRHPSRWQVLDSGLMAANPFGLTQYQADAGLLGDHLLHQQSLCCRYRVCVHRGDVSLSKVADRYLDFVAPPDVEVVRD